jgi:hypothetical protein
MAEPWVPLDDIREELATRIIELGGQARGAAAREKRELVLDALGRRAWLGAWEGAVRRAAERVAQALDHAITAAAHQARMPRARWRRRLLSGGERRAIGARLGSGAERFVAALDALDAAAGRALEASVLDKDAHVEWQDALRAAARRLEAAWLSLEDELAAEARRWAPEVEAVARWRPSLWPVAAFWTPIALVSIWLSLLLGGYVRAPLWLSTLFGF